jgi:hypothetical protein
MLQTAARESAAKLVVIELVGGTDEVVTIGGW